MVTEVYNGEIILDIVKVLQRHTDENHRLTQKEIVEILKKDYGYAKVHRKTVKKYLEMLARYSERDDVNEIFYTEKKRKRKNKKTGEIEIVKGFTNFGYAHDFTDGELRLIIDSILFSKYMPDGQRKQLIEKLEKLSSKYFDSGKKHIHTLSNSGPRNHNLFYNIETLNQAINESKQVSFHYNTYRVDKNLNLVLMPRKNKDGQPREYIINPYRMVTTNGRFYLICNNDKYDAITHYRIDRITNIEKLEKKRKPLNKVKEAQNGFDLSKYMAEHIYMFAGESITVSLRMNQQVLNEFVDWFGTENIQFSNRTEEEVTATVSVNREAMRKWALQYALHVRVISPKSLVEDIKSDIEKALRNYQ